MNRLHDPQRRADVRPRLSLSVLLVAAFGLGSSASHRTAWASGAAAGLPVADQGDLPRIKQRKVLRVLVPGGGEGFLPRSGRPESADRDLALEFARRIGVKAEFVVVSSFDQFLPMLIEGKGDLVAAQLTVTPERSKSVAFTRPLSTISEVVVGKRGSPNLPKSVKDLAGRDVHVRPASSYADTIRALAMKDAPGIKLVEVGEAVDEEEIVYQVTKGLRPLTVVDSHLLHAIQAYNTDAEGLFNVAEGRQIAWAVRNDARLLKAEADEFIIEKAMTTYAHDSYFGDLAEIKKRGVVRVLTRNNPVTYFLYRGEQLGFEYELSRLLAQKLGVRLEMVVVPSRDQLIPWLLEGRGDLIAASMTRTPERESQVAFSEPYLRVDEIVVQKKGSKVALKSVEDLKGKTIHVRRSSSYYATLEKLKQKVGDFTIVFEPEDLETEQIIERVGTAQVPLTVADSHILELELTYRDDVEAAFLLPASTLDGSPAKTGDTFRDEIAFALRRDEKELRQVVNDFVKKSVRGLEYNMAKKRYFQNKRQIVSAKEGNFSESGVISKYDELIKRYSEQYGLDWRLMAAQAFQESRFDPQAKSWVGALGLFQVMPRTGEELGFTNLSDPEEGVHAGVKYMDWLIKQFDPKIPFKHRMRFALASYNAGRGHVLDAQRIAADMGLDPNKWFGHVERAMLLLQRPDYAKRARYGFCRGEEPVNYVSQIQTRYLAFVKVAKE